MNFPSRIARDKLLCSSLQIPSSVCCTCYLLFLTNPPSLPFPISIKNSNGKNARVASDETQAKRREPKASTRNYIQISLHALQRNDVLGWVVQSWVQITQGQCEIGFQLWKLLRKIQQNSFCQHLIGCSIQSRENNPKKAIEQTSVETQIKI